MVGLVDERQRIFEFERESESLQSSKQENKNKKGFINRLLSSYASMDGHFTSPERPMDQDFELFQKITGQKIYCDMSAAWFCSEFSLFSGFVFIKVHSQVFRN